MDFLERKKMKKHNLAVSLVACCAFLLLSACGSAATETPTSTPTPVDVNAIATEAIQTFVVQLTQNAPTITPTPLPTDTPAASPTPFATVALGVPTAASCANYQFISETIPDGTEMTVNQTFTKTWKVKNTGTCDWTTNFKLAFSYGEAMGGQTVSLADTVKPGDTVSLSVDLKAPNKTGEFRGFWAILDDKGAPVGSVLYVDINVVAASTTPTATGDATATTEPTATETPTP
jgi:hypothetical protein